MDEAVVTSAGKAGPSGFLDTLLQRWNSLPPARRVMVLSIGAAFLALLVVALLWSREPSYRILFANLPDKDGGVIIQSLQQMNVPYKLETGGAISVPADKVYDVRLRLAAQGLPKASGSGFEIIENQKFGISQFGEQINYQRAIEGELARSVESIDSVESARVHLAFPKQTVFLRDQQRPTASVLVTLHGGRTLDAGQVSSILHLVASSVPQLQPKDVTVVDQNGNLLSKMTEEGTGIMDQRQLKYVHQIEQTLGRRIETILSPILGQNNVKAEVTATVDFAEVEETSETYKPNSPPNAQAIRSAQSVETNGAQGQAASGVPGALSNQPPGAASAPINLPSPPGAAPATASSGSTHKENTTNYELDKTIQHVKQPIGVLKRLSVAVVVNYRLQPNKQGKLSAVPLTQNEMNQINNLAKEAMGYSKERGDALSVVNASFAENSGLTAEVSLLDKILAYLAAHGADVAKVLLVALALGYLLFGVVRPVMRDIIKPKQDKTEPASEIDILLGVEGEEVAEDKPETEEDRARMAAFADLLQQAKEYAKNDPRMAATIIREWLTQEDEKK